MIQTIKFKCETITPMFLAGADGKTPELRVPSIKGALRFWWRALNANLVTENNDYSELKRQESAIFGGTDNSGRSKVILSIDNQTTNTITAHPTPHNEKFKKDAFAVGSKFEITINVMDNTVLNAEQVKSLFIVVSLLGGLGNRSRRCFGSFKITKIDDVDFKQPNDVEAIKDIIDSINPEYTTENNMANYPYVKFIEIGQGDNDITKKIGQATNEVHSLDYREAEQLSDENNNWNKFYKNGKEIKKPNKKYLKYPSSLGDANPRFSSPIYVSAIKKNDGKLYPIITTLNTVSPSGKGDKSIQQTFKNELL